MARIACRLGLFFLVTTACIAMGARLSEGQAAPAPAPDCTSDLIQLLPCLDFLTNSSVSSVVPACCQSLANVSASSPYCLCQLISPTFSNQSAQLGINDTRALQLPGLCSLNLSPANCAAILGPSAAPAPLPLVPAAAPAPIIVPAPAAPGPAVDCNSEIASLQGCVSFLSGTETTPSTGCCTNLGSVVSTAPQCLCTLADSAAITAVNITLVQELPQLCSVPFSISQCANVGAAPAALPTGSEGPGSDENHGARSAASSSVHLAIALGLAALSHALFH